MNRRKRTARPKQPLRYSLPVIGAAVAALMVAGASFFRSFTALSELAVDYAVPLDQAWTLAIGLDGIVVVATVCAATLRNQARRRYSWFLLIAGTILSVVGNGIHAWLLTESAIGVGIAVIPPLALLAAIHLTVVLAQEMRENADAFHAANEEITTPPTTPTTVPEPAESEQLVTDAELRIPDEWLDENPRPAAMTEEMSAPVTEPVQDTASAEDVEGVVIDSDLEPERAKEWALAQLRGGVMSYVDIAQKVKRSEGTIRRWRDAAGIPARRDLSESPSDRLMVA